MPPTTRSGAPPAKDARHSQSPATSRTNNPVRVTDRTVELRVLTDQAARLVGQIGDQAAREQRAYDAGYRAAAQLYRAVFDDGVDVGRAQAEHEMEQAWSAVAEKVRAMARVPTHAELQARRHPGHTADQIRKLTGRDRFPLSDRECPHCYGRGYFPGGAW